MAHPHLLKALDMIFQSQVHVLDSKTLRSISGNAGLKLMGFLVHTLLSGRSVIHNSLIQSHLLHPIRKHCEETWFVV